MSVSNVTKSISAKLLIQLSKRLFYSFTNLEFILIIQLMWILRSFAYDLA